MAAIIFIPAFVPALVKTTMRTKMPAGIGFGWKRSSWCRVGFAGLCVYLAFAATAHRKALAYTKEYAATNHLQVETLAALPLPPTFTHWSGLIGTPQGVWRTTFHVPGGETESQVFYAETLSDRYVEEAKELRDVQIYLWFARFPLWHIEQHGAQTVVDVTDVRFFRDADGAGSQANAAGFTFEVVFGAEGDVIFEGMKPPQN